jgi:hypothetical protein
MHVKCVFHELRESVSRAIMSSSFVGMTRHNRSDSVIDPSIGLLSISFERITRFRIATRMSACDA